MSIKWSLLPFALLSVAPACLSAEPRPIAEYIAAVEEPKDPDWRGYVGMPLEQLMEKLHVPGAAITVIKDYEVHWSKAYGIADAKTGARVDNDTLFQAASISKPVTAMAMLKLIEEGKFALDDDINSILRSWKLPEDSFVSERRVTPRMLASHTSGLGDGFGFPGYAPGTPLPSVIEILNGQAPSNVGPVFMERPPLHVMKYSGGGYTVLQLALTDTVGRPFPQILQQYVLDPIGMTSSSFEQPLSSYRNRDAARGHDGEGKPMGPKWHVYPELAAAGMWTTSADLAKFLIEVQKSVHGQANRVLSRAASQEMLNPIGIGDFAVGFAMEKEGQGWYFQHSGSNWGFICLLIGHKLNGYGVVVMTNSSGGQPFVSEIKKRVERVYGWDSINDPVLRRPSTSM